MTSSYPIWMVLGLVLAFPFCMVIERTRDVGHNPIPPRPAPTREDFHLGRARAAYLAGDIDLDRFEELAGHVLSGGHLSQALEPRGGPGKPPPPTDVGNRSTS